MSTPRAAAAALLTSIQRRSSRCSRKDFTGPPSSSDSVSVSGERPSSGSLTMGKNRQPGSGLLARGGFRHGRGILVGHGGGGQLLLGRRGRLIHGIMDLVRHLVRRLL